MSILPAAQCPLSETELDLDPKPYAYFGRGRVSHVGPATRATGATSALIVTDAFLATSPVVAAVRESLENSGILVSVFDGVTPNPTTTSVDAGSDLARDLGVEAIVAVGGGSSMDAAKGISIGAVNPQRGIQLDYTSVFENPSIPIVAVPTTSGTGAEVNAFGVVTDVESQRKFYVGSTSALARAAILDPDLTVGLPASATAATGMDALTHALESYLSLRNNPYSDGIALQVISTVADFLPRASGSPIPAWGSCTASHIRSAAVSTSPTASRCRSSSRRCSGSTCPPAPNVSLVSPSPSGWVTPLPRLTTMPKRRSSRSRRSHNA